MGEDTMFQLATDNYSTVLESGINGGRQANFTVKEFVLTEKFAPIAQAGLIIHGCNWTITKIMIADVVAGPNDGNENENADPLSGTIVLNDTAWWTQKNISKNDLLCGQSLENIAKITLSSTGNFVIGFNNLDGSGTITEYNKDPYWSQIEGASEYVLDLDNINFDVYNFIVALTNHEGVDYTITWKVELKEGVTPEQPGTNEPAGPQIEYGKGSVSFVADSGWTEYELSKEELLCGVEPEQVAGFKFSGETNISVGFTSFSEGGWTQYQDKTSHEVGIEEINFTGFAFKFALSNNDNQEYTITWEVELKEGVTPEEPGTDEPEGPQIESGKGSVSFVADSGWTEYELSKEELLCGVELDQVAGFKFSGETNISVGFTSFSEGGWTQYQDKTSHEVSMEEINFSGFAFKFALCNNDNQEYTITWEVVLKEEGGNEGGEEGGEGGQQPQPEVGKGSMVFSEKTGWVQQAVSKEQLLAGVAEEQVAGFKFNCTIDMYVGFNGAAGGWVEHKDKPSHEIPIEEIDMAGFGMNLALWNETSEYTITWEVVLKEEGGNEGGNEGGEGDQQPQPDPQPQPNPTGAIVFEAVEEAAWIEKAVTKEQILCGVEPSEVAAIRFSGPVYIYVGFNGAAGGWTEYKEQTSHEIGIEEISLDGFGMNLALWNDGNEYTITWEVIKK